MSTDNIEEKIKKEEQKTPTSIDADISRIESESDESLDAAPTDTPRFAKPVVPKKSFKERLLALLHSKKFWLIFVSCLLVLLLTAWFIQPSRIWLVNLFGQRTNLQVTIKSTGDSTQESEVTLKNAAVTINDRQFKTDQQGKVTRQDQPYGKAIIQVNKAGYEPASREVMLDFDPFFHLLGGKQNDQDARNIAITVKSIGIPVEFTAIDWLSNTPITTGEYIAGDLVIKPNEQGVVRFRAPAADDNKVVVRSNHGGLFNDQDITLQLNSSEKPTITFIPGGKHYFMSNRDGALGIYSSNMDGTDPQQIIPGTGQEKTYEASFAVSPGGKYGVLASTREGARNAKKELITKLYVVDLEKKQLHAVDEGASVTFNDWSGDTLIYEKRMDAEITETSLQTLDVTTRKVTELIKTYDVSVVYVALDQIVASLVDDVNKNGQFEPAELVVKRINLKDKSIRELGNNITGISQLDYDRIGFTSSGSGQEYNLNTGQVKPTAELSKLGRRYINITNADGSKRLFLDIVDANRALFTKTTADGAEKQVVVMNGLTTPITWRNEVITFSVLNLEESAAYAVSLRGGPAKKITNITNGNPATWHGN